MLEDGKRFQGNEAARFLCLLELNMYRSRMNQLQIPTLVPLLRSEPIKRLPDMIVKRQIEGSCEAEEPQQVVTIPVRVGEA